MHEDHLRALLARPDPRPGAGADAERVRAGRHRPSAWPATRILFRDILPNVMTTLFVFVPLMMAINDAHGIGALLPVDRRAAAGASWGTIIQDGRNSFTPGRWWRWRRASPSSSRARLTSSATACATPLTRARSCASGAPDARRHRQAAGQICSSWSASSVLVFPDLSSPRRAPIRAARIDRPQRLAGNASPPCARISGSIGRCPCNMRS